MEIKKECSKCKQEYPATTQYFTKNQNGKYGLRSHCKQCQILYNTQYYRVHKIRLSQQSRKRSKQYYKTIIGHLRQMFTGMLQRCNNPKNKDYKYYGGRGIKVKFRSFNDFYNFIINVLKIDPRGLTIDRIDNEGHYKRWNIRFVSQSENCRNRRKIGEMHDE